MKKCAIVNRTELYRKLVLDFTSVAPLCAYHVFDFNGFPVQYYPKRQFNRDSFGNKSYQCSMCYLEGSIQYNVLLRRLLESRDLSYSSGMDEAMQPPGMRRTYPCPNCNKVYLFRQSRHRHLKFECGKRPQFSCTACDYMSFHKKFKYRLSKSASKNRSSMFQSDPSMLSSSSQPGAELSNMNFEFDFSNSKPMTFPCSNCNKNFKYYQNRWRHQKYECGKLPQFQCGMCPYAAHQKSSLKGHVQRKHAEQLTQIHENF
ncbi:zinc finger protein 648-like [Ctenocephalides felis]|uniref:zinc finger protein 648-like n=1 Tax=Ctenocephalides felis TaxID=7515 RepID=UPI000E6E26B5|nr:zinc finger protein 648-like [Ctenocephalides felis]